MPEAQEILGVAILAFLGVFVALVLLDGLFMLIGARLAGLRNARFGKAVLAAIACSFVTWVLALVCSIVPVAGSIFGFLLGQLFSLLIIKAIFETTFGGALLTWIFNTLAQIAALIFVIVVLAAVVVSS